MVFPISMGKLINVVAFVSKPVLPEHAGVAETAGERTWPAKRPWVEDASEEEMLKVGIFKAFSFGVPVPDFVNQRLTKDMKRKLLLCSR